jgi:hypothetical protein
VGILAIKKCSKACPSSASEAGTCWGMHKLVRPAYCGSALENQTIVIGVKLNAERNGAGVPLCRGGPISTYHS